MRRERRKKKFLTPRLCSIWSTVWEQKKKTPQHKSTYTINTWLATGGTYPALASSHPVQCHLFPRRSQTCSTGGGTKRYRGSWSGRGVMSVMGEGSKRSPTASLSQGSLSSMTLAKAPVRGARKDKIELLWLLGRTAANFHSSFSLSILKSPSFTCKAVNFIMMASIFRFIVSVSLLTALPTASIKTGSLVRLWTAVPVFRIFR